MKIDIPKEWLLERAHLEEGLEIGAGGPPKAPTGLRWDLFPVKEMYKRGWFEGFTGSLSEAAAEAEGLVAAFVTHVGRRPVVSLQRQRVRARARSNPYALLAWQYRVLSQAVAAPASQAFKHSSLTEGWLKALVQLSRLSDGPKRAKRYVEEAGIAVVIEPHLSSTYLDGAALLGEERPVIGLTLRHDRLDNFWFVLLHELMHIKMHLKKGSVEDIFDDLEAEPDEIEREADECAGNALIPEIPWKTALARYIRSEESVMAFASANKISPAIVAGRVRMEASNYVILHNLVGQGRVRALFPDVHFGL
jgi:HTH-type transcriptional regulator/antitoxin HigA